MEKEKLLIQNIPCWGDDSPKSHQENSSEKAETATTAQFPIRTDLNAKIAIWKGDMTQVCADALVHSTNESLTAHLKGDDLSARIIKYNFTVVILKKNRLAGSEIEVEMTRLEGTCYHSRITQVAELERRKRPVVTG